MAAGKQFALWERIVPGSIEDVPVLSHFISDDDIPSFHIVGIGNMQLEPI